jgi:hypothetical protein
MTNDQLAAVVAEQIMGWTVGPERFMLGGRRWLPRWRFQPATRLEDAFRALKQANPQEYSFGATATGGFWARVRVAGTTGEAHESSQARAMTVAIARAFGIETPTGTGRSQGGSGGGGIRDAGA